MGSNWFWYKSCRFLHQMSKHFIASFQMPSDSGPPLQQMVHQPPAAANVRSNGLCRRTSFRTSGVSLGSQGPKAVASPKSPPPNLVMPPDMALAPPPQVWPQTQRNYYSACFFLVKCELRVGHFNKLSQKTVDLREKRLKMR